MPKQTGTAFVETKGIEGLRKWLERFGKSGKKVLRPAMEQATQPAFVLTQERCPFKTGKLQGTGRISIRVGPKQITAKIIYGNNDDVRYAAWVHKKNPWVQTTVEGYPFLQHLALVIDLEAMGRG